jgi:hypothetical protein
MSMAGLFAVQAIVCIEAAFRLAVDEKCYGRDPG